MMPLPSKSGDAAPVPTGGEFVLAPLQKKDASAHYANAAKVIDCLVGADRARSRPATRSGTSPPTRTCAPSRSRPTRSGSRGRPSIESAQGRTTDLGPDYTATSGKLSMALQAALNAAGDAAAVKTAFAQAATVAGCGRGGPVGPPHHTAGDNWVEDAWPYELRHLARGGPPVH